MKTRASAEVFGGDQLDEIKKMAIQAMFADDDLMEVLVLKGGNAMDIIHKANSRASVDLDFSMGGDLDHEAAQAKVARALVSTFDMNGLLAFDIKLHVRPGKMPSELASFWGGYLVEFKLISKGRAEELGHDLGQMRREAIRLGEGSKFTIDISRHEYVEGKETHDLGGYTIYVYSPAMIVCEKLRAICQQMPEYAEVIQRSGAGKQRARDFIDIEALVVRFKIDIETAEARGMVRQMFAAKKVPLELLAKIETVRDQHALGYQEVRAAMRPGVDVQPFDHYFDFVTNEVKKLEALWNE